MQIENLLEIKWAIIKGRISDFPNSSKKFDLCVGTKHHNTANVSTAFPNSMRIQTNSQYFKLFILTWVPLKL